MATIRSSPHWGGCCMDILPNLQHWFLEEVSRRIHSFSNLQLAIVRSCLPAFQKLYFHMRVRSVLCRSMLTFCVAKCLLFPQMPDPNTVPLATSHFVASAFCVAPAIISWKVSLSMASTLLQTRWHFRHSRSTCDVWQLLQASWLRDAISPNSFSYSGSYFKYRGEGSQIFYLDSFWRGAVGQGVIPDVVWCSIGGAYGWVYADFLDSFWGRVSSEVSFDVQLVVCMGRCKDIFWICFGGAYFRRRKRGTILQLPCVR